MTGQLATWRKRIRCSQASRAEKPVTLAASKVLRQHDRNAEARIQAAIVEWIRTVAPHVRVWAVPNGGLRGKREAALLKWTGVLAGVFDLTIVGRDGQAWLIEVKTDTGYLSDDQEAFGDWCVAQRVPHCICRSIDDARRAFAFWGIETREVVRLEA